MRHVTSTTLCLAVLLVPPLAAQTASGTCTTVFAAEQKEVITPHRTFTTMTRGGKDQTAESITTADANYVNMRGQWRRSPLTPQDMLNQKKENIRNAKSYDCQALHDEAVNGVPATVYHVHSVVEDVGTSDGQLWVAKATGLPVKVEMDTASPDGKMHTSTRYEYDNAQAPAGVK